MADKKLNLIVDLINNTESKFKEIANDMSAMQKRTENIQSMFSSMTRVGTIGFGVMSAAIGFAAKEAGEAAAITSQLNSVLKSTGGVAGVTAEKAVSLSKALQSQTTFTDEAVLSAENMLLTFTNIKDDIFPEATRTVLDMSVALGQDTKNSSIQLGKALQDPILGISALRKVGVAFTEDQKNMVEALVKSGNTLEAQKLILRELNTEFGGSAVAATQNFQGALIQLKNKVVDAGESIGVALAPAVLQLVTAITPIVDRISAWIEANPKLVSSVMLTVTAVFALIAAIGILGNTVLSIGRGLVVFSGLFSGLGTVITYLARTTISTTLMQAFAAMKTGLAAATAAVAQLRIALTLLQSVGILLVITALVYVGKLLYDLGKNMMEFADEVGSMGDAIALTFTQLKLDVTNFAATATEKLAGVTEKIPWLGNALREAADGYKIMAKESDAAMNDMTNALVKPITAVEEVKTKTKADFDAIAANEQLLADATAAASEKMKEHFKKVVDSVAEVKKEIIATYTDIKKAALDYNKNLAGEQTSYEQSIVDTVAGAYAEKTKLEADLAVAVRKGEMDKQTEIQQSIAAQMVLINSYAQSKLQLDSQIAEERKRLAMNEIERLTFDHSKKLLMMQVEYLTEQAARLQKIKELQAEQDAILAMVSKSQQAAVLAEVAKGQAFKDRIAAEKLAQGNWVTESIAQYQSYVATVNSILSSMNTYSGVAKIGVSIATANKASGTRASGGAVQTGRTFLVGEKGPELFTPQQNGQILANGIGGTPIVINISGNSFMGEADLLDKVGDSLMRAIQRNVRL